jgi:outer membrane protein assembly factor BamB
MNRLSALFAFPILLAAAASTLFAENWPAWRGPNANGVSNARDLPVTWTQTENIRWKTPLDGPCNSTPIVWGDRVFLTQGLDGGRRRAIVAIDRSSGKKLWLHEVPCSVEETSHRDNPPCSGSPATDGNAVYAHFASAGVVACDFVGKELWHRDLGPVLHKWGNGTSPVIYKNLLIIYQGPGEPTFITALDKRTGKTIWEKKEPGINSPVFGSWSTPVVITVGGRDELIMPLPGDRVGGDGEFKAYDPMTGDELWRCVGLGTEVYAMPVVSAARDLIIGISGHNGPTMAVRPGGRGDVTESHRLWHTTSNPQRIGSGVLHDGHLYLADADGFAECLDARNGERVWKERLAGKLWGSMLLADGRLHVSNLEGQTFVLAASPKFELIAKNDIGEPTYSALAVSNGELFLRTYENLYCIAKHK